MELTENSLLSMQTHTCTVHTKYTAHLNNQKIQPLSYTAINSISLYSYGLDLHQYRMWEGILLSFAESYNIHSPIFNTDTSKQT
jgi:hypothetical protein